MNDNSTKIQNIFGGLIGSKTRVRILLRLFLNATERAYLREMAKEFDLSPSIVKEELRQLSAAGLLTSEKNGRSIYYSANTEHPLANCDNIPTALPPRCPHQPERWTRPRTAAMRLANKKPVTVRSTAIALLSVHMAAPLTAQVWTKEPAPARQPA